MNLSAVVALGLFDAFIWLHVAMLVLKGAWL